jgi:hypothetical protein
MRVAERAAKLCGLDMPTKVAVTDPEGGIPLESVRRVLDRLDRAKAAAEAVDVTASAPAQIEGPDENT